MENKIPTAEDLLEQIVKSDEWGYNDFYDFAGQTQDISTQLRLIKQLAIEFAKLHVKVALSQVDDSELCGCDCGEAGILLNQIDNIKIKYPKENIK